MAKSPQERKREEKLKAVQAQIEDGSLVIRKMTAKERSANPPRPPKRKQRS
jgi:hypothetical protein